MRTYKRELFIYMSKYGSLPSIQYLDITDAQVIQRGYHFFTTLYRSCTNQDRTTFFMSGQDVLQ